MSYTATQQISLSSTALFARTRRVGADPQTSSFPHPSAVSGLGRTACCGRSCLHCEARTKSHGYWHGLGLGSRPRDWYSP